MFIQKQISVCVPRALAAGATNALAEATSARAAVVAHAVFILVVGLAAAVSVLFLSTDTPSERMHAHNETQSPKWDPLAGQ
jgi:hypothetical protein